MNIYYLHNVWIDTRPINEIDLGTKDATTIFKYAQSKFRSHDESVSQSTTETPQTTINKKSKEKKKGMKPSKDDECKGNGKKGIHDHDNTGMPKPAE